MIRSRVAAAILIPLLGMPTGAFGAAPPTITHEKLSCIPYANSKITAKVEFPSRAAAVRIYFHSTKYETERYLEARHAGEGLYWAILPIPKSETDQVEYRIVATDALGGEVQTERYVVDVESKCDMPLDEKEKEYAQNLVIGLTDDKQDPVPEGFKCEGIISKITVQGVLLPHDECRAILAAFLIPPGVWVAAGVAAVAGGVVIATDKDPKPISPYRPSTSR